LVELRFVHTGCVALWCRTALRDILRLFCGNIPRDAVQRTASGMNERLVHRDVVLNFVTCVTIPTFSRTAFCIEHRVIFWALSTVHYCKWRSKFVHFLALKQMFKAARKVSCCRKIPKTARIRGEFMTRPQIP